MTVDEKMAALADELIPVISDWYLMNGCDRVTPEHIRERMGNEQIVARYLWMKRHPSPLFRQWLESTPASPDHDQSLPPDHPQTTPDSA